MKIDKEQKLIDATEILFFKNRGIVGDLWRDKPIRGRSRWVYIGDISDHLKLCDLIFQKKYKKAYSFYYNLDTDSRDKIPKTIVNLLESLCAKKL